MPCMPKKSWLVDAFDYSDEARGKTLQVATDADATINYEVMQVQNFEAVKQYGAVFLIYVHLNATVRKTFCKKIMQALERGGFLVMKVFAKKHLQNNSRSRKRRTLI